MGGLLRGLESRPNLRLAALALAALVMSFTPVLASFLGWFETFFHELSHGMAALLTGASILSINLSWDGSGLIRYAGSWAPFLVTFSGYPGAVLCGIALYLTGANGNRWAHNMPLVLSLVIAVAAILWMRDAQSLIISGLMIVALMALWRFSESIVPRLATQLIAVHMMVGGIHSIWSILGWRGRGDAQLLADMTWLPAFIFPPVWLGLGLAALWQLWRWEAGRAATRN